MLHVDILPHRLRLISISNDFLGPCMHTCAKPLLDGSSPFFSFTRTGYECSLIIEDSLSTPLKTLSHLSEGKVSIETQIWRAFHVYVGASGEGGEFITKHIVEAIATPLADHGISIFQLSTHACDYTLVPEVDLDRAVEVLSKVFTVTRMDEPDLAGTAVSEKVANDNDILLQAASMQEETKSNSRKIAYSEKSYFMLTLSNTEQQNHLITLLSAMFYDAVQKDTFLSYSCIEDEISLVIDSELLQSLTKSNPSLAHRLSHSHDTWRLLNIEDGPLGFATFGIVRDMAQKLLRQGQLEHIAYVSTYRTDYIIVPVEDFARALSVLND